LALDPEDRDLLLAAAEQYRKLGDPRRALAHLQNLLETYPGGEAPQMPLDLAGEAYLALGRHAAAADAFSAACRAGPPSAPLLCRLGEAELLAGRLAAAEAAAGAALALEPANVGGQALHERVALARLEADGARRR
jgi:tetratricopeptide (TPR) repeat protein